MFWSKLWLAVVTLAAAVALVIALLAPRPLARDVERESGARLERAQHAASLLLKVNARKWMDTAAQVAQDAVLVEALDQATRDQAQKSGDLGLVHKTVQERLRYFNDRMRVDLVLATDAKGRVIARAGLDEGVYRDGVEGLPVVADALRGLRGDDTWSLDGKLYRVAATPVIKAERYAGTLVIGQEVGGELAQSMKQVLEVDVAFLLRGRVLAASTQLPVLQRLPVLVDEQQAELQRAGHSEPLVAEAAGDRAYLVVLAPFVGEASEHKAAYALLVPRPQTASLPALLTQLASTDPKTVPWLQLAPIGGGLLLALVIGLFFMQLESARPIKRLQREAQALARGELQRLDDDKHPGKLGTIARAVNTTLDRIGSGANRSPAIGQRGAEPMLRPPSPTDSSALASLGLQPVQHTPPPIMSPLSSPEHSTPLPVPIPSDSSPLAMPNGGAAGFGYSEPSAEFNSPPTTPRKQSNTGAQTALEGPAAVSAAKLDALPVGRAPREKQPQLDTGELPTSVASPQVATLPPPSAGGPDLIDAPELLSSLREPAVAKGRTTRGFGDDDPTRTAPASAALIAMTQVSDSSEQQAEPHIPGLRPPLPSSGPQPSVEEAPADREFEQVYQDFLETKQRLGEPTEGVTYDRFVAKLKANRQQLITKYACKTVKFQVYVKDGKAALKATPVQA